MDTQNSKLVFRDFPIFNWVAGLFFLILGLSYAPLLVNGVSAGSAVIICIEIGIGLILILSGSIMTVSADRATQTLTLANRSIIKGSRKEIPFAEIDAVQLEMSSSNNRSGRRGGPSYRITVICKDGQAVPFHSYYTSGTASKMKQVEKLRAFLGVGGEDPGGGIKATLKAASQMAQHVYQEQQETLTGSEAAEHVTNGVHWKVQTITFGGSPVTRWFSPDFKMQDSFLFLAQKVAGQGSSAGGLLSGLGNLFFKESLKFYGFSKEDLPGLERGAPFPALGPGLDPHFSAFTNDANAARQVLNPWVSAPLADWAGRYPLKKLQGRGVFGQLAVMYSPLGVYVGSMGTMIPEAVEEMTNLGVELVKAQGSHS